MNWPGRGARKTHRRQPRKVSCRLPVARRHCQRSRPKRCCCADSYRQSASHPPNSATALSLIRLLSVQGAGNEAKAVADGWLKSNPRDLAVRRALADHLARTGDYRRARTEYETAIKQGTADAELLNNLANVHLQLKDAKAAVSAAEQALAMPEQSGRH